MTHLAEEVEVATRGRGYLATLAGRPATGGGLAQSGVEAETIAITGTNGKTTTTALTGALLAEQPRPVFVGGNIGTPLAARALDFPAGGLVVAEVSSFQLETIEAFQPRVAAVLNVTPDHLDRHRTFDRYLEAKARIFMNQTEHDCAVLNADDEAARGLAGVQFYNDSKGTNVASTIKALESFAERIVLIAGGKGKGQDFTPLADAARGRVTHAVVIGEDGGRIAAALASAGIGVSAAETLASAIQAARGAARAGDVVLLSPACASFVMFDNYY